MLCKIRENLRKVVLNYPTNDCNLGEAILSICAMQSTRNGQIIPNAAVFNCYGCMVNEDFSNMKTLIFRSIDKKDYNTSAWHQSVFQETIYKR